jgi:hypothetical protein
VRKGLACTAKECGSNFCRKCIEDYQRTYGKECPKCKVANPDFQDMNLNIKHLLNKL